MADFVRHADDTATIIHAICKILDDIEMFDTIIDCQKLIEENLKENKFLIKPEYDELSFAEQNIEDLLNDKVKERKERFEIASAHECVTGNCFVAGTLVTTADGKKPIEKIKIGDKVLSSMEDTNQIAFKQVTNTFVNETNELVHISVKGL